MKHIRHIRIINRFPILNQRIDEQWLVTAEYDDVERSVAVIRLESEDNDIVYHEPEMLLGLTKFLFGIDETSDLVDQLFDQV